MNIISFRSYLDKIMSKIDPYVYVYVSDKNINYDYLSDIAQYEGTLLDKREFVRNYLDRTYQRFYNVKGTVGYVSSLFPNNTSQRLSRNMCRHEVS